MTLSLLFIKVIALSSAGLFAGGLVMVMCAIVPSWRVMLPEEWVRNQQYVGPYIDRYMPLLDVVAVLSTLLLLRFFWSNFASMVWSITALLGFIAVALISQLVNVPLNRQVRTWPDLALPTHALQLRRGWIIWHAIRTAFGIVAFIALLLAVII